MLSALKAAGFQPVVKTDLRAAVANKEVAAAVEETEEEAGGKRLSIYIDRTRQASDIAGDKIRTALDKLKVDTVRASLRGSGVSEKILTPFTTQRVNVASEKKMSGLIFGSALGYIVILLMFTGAMYPAIDMTAGEKERRTLEAVLCSPAGRNEIVLGKIVATSTAAFITALLTLGSMAYSFRFAPHASQAQEAFHMAGPDIGSLAMALFAVIPTAIMAASIMVAIALFAKSYKEGQSYLTPIVMSHRDVGGISGRGRNASGPGADADAGADSNFQRLPAHQRNLSRRILARCVCGGSGLEPGLRSDCILYRIQNFQERERVVPRVEQAFLPVWDLKQKHSRVSVRLSR